MYSFSDYDWDSGKLYDLQIAEEVEFSIWVSNLEKWFAQEFTAIQTPYLDMDSLSVCDCGWIFQDILIRHGYLDAEPEELQQIETDEDEIVEINVGN